MSSNLTRKVWSENQKSRSMCCHSYCEKNLLALPIISYVNERSGKGEAQYITIRFNDLENMGDKYSVGGRS